MHDGGFEALVAGVRTAAVAGFAPDGHPQVTLPGAEPVAARSLVPLTTGDVGREAAVVAQDGGGLLILGLLQPPARVVAVDGERLVIAAEEEVVLRCGKASITLKADGRVTIRGTQVLSRSEGPNRVQGASVQLN